MKHYLSEKTNVVMFRSPQVKVSIPPRKKVGSIGRRAKKMPTFQVILSLLLFTHRWTKRQWLFEEFFLSRSFLLSSERWSIAQRPEMFLWTKRKFRKFMQGRSSNVLFLCSYSRWLWLTIAVRMWMDRILFIGSNIHVSLQTKFPMSHSPEYRYGKK